LQARPESCSFRQLQRRFGARRGPTRSRGTGRPRLRAKTRPSASHGDLSESELESEWQARSLLLRTGVGKLLGSHQAAGLWRSSEPSNTQRQTPADEVTAPRPRTPEAAVAGASCSLRLELTARVPRAIPSV
jgi:hypothetical protein